MVILRGIFQCLQRARAPMGNDAVGDRLALGTYARVQLIKLSLINAARTLQLVIRLSFVIA